eukprot:6675898-Alexandrium_andersonii.AAC.1
MKSSMITRETPSGSAEPAPRASAHPHDARAASAKRSLCRGRIEMRALVVVSGKYTPCLTCTPGFPPPNPPR